MQLTSFGVASIALFGAMGASCTVLSGCSQTQTQSGANSNAGDAEDDPTQDSAQVNSKMLVAFFSAQGHTRAVASAIADELDANMFEIMPAQVYNEVDLDRTNSQSRVMRERDSEQLQRVALEVENPEKWADYGRVIVCYPIWWDVAAYPVSTFVSVNDFSGKVVIPVCTSESSSIDNSASALSANSLSGDWRAGRRFESDVSEDDVRAWARSI